MPHADSEASREYHRRYREAHREEARAYAKAYREQHPERVRAKRQKWERTKAVAWREKRRLQKHDDLVECAICHRKFAFLGRHIRTHDIDTDEYRRRFPSHPLLSVSLTAKRSQAGLDRARRHDYDGQEPDRTLYAFLTGAMLGDGSLECKKVNARYADASSNELYARWKHHLLSVYFPCTITRRTARPHKKTGKQYVAWFVRTCVHPFLTSWYNEWYGGGPKHIPRDLVEEYLDPFALAVWYFDDGHNGKDCPYLYTMGFDSTDVEWLTALLLSRFGLLTAIRFNKQGQPMILIQGDSRARFLDLVRPHVVPGMEYKVVDRRGGDRNAASDTAGLSDST